ncbi:hypothetical protein ACFW3C_22565 [Streptomyces sp. NPDC058871]
MAETERESIREATLEGLDAASRKGKHGGRPPVITDDMLHTVLRRRAAGESVEKIRPDLITPLASARDRTPAWPASTGRSPSTRSARRTPKPSERPTPTSLPSMPKAPTGRSELLVTSPDLWEDRAQGRGTSASSTRRRPSCRPSPARSARIPSRHRRGWAVVTTGIPRRRVEGPPSRRRGRPGSWAHGWSSGTRPGST